MICAECITPTLWIICALYFPNCALYFLFPNQNHRTQLTAVIKMSLSRAWIFVRNVFKNITVEPIVFLYVINACTYQIVFQNLQIEKACKVNLNHTADVCDNLKDPANEDVQNEVRNPHLGFLSRSWSVKWWCTEWGRILVFLKDSSLSSWSRSGK